MTTTAVVYKPKEGADLSAIIRNDNANISESVARELYNIYLTEPNNLPVPKRQFEHNLSYELANGVVFRLFNNQTGNDSLALEFLGAPDAPERKTEALAAIPDLLATTKLVDRETVESIRRAIERPKVDRQK